MQFNIFCCGWHKTAELLSITSTYKIEFWGREGGEGADGKIERETWREPAVDSGRVEGGRGVVKLVILYM